MQELLKLFYKESLPIMDPHWNMYSLKYIRIMYFKYYGGEVWEKIGSLLSWKMLKLDNSNLEIYIIFTIFYIFKFS